MFNLIITIISIALIVVMAVASVYYGGEAFTQGTARGNASALLQQAQQINAGFVMAVNNGEAHASVADLIAGDYLAAAPTPPATVTTGAWVIDTVADETNSYVAVKLTAEDTCTAVNESSGYTQTGAVTTTDVQARALIDDADQAYGCEKVGDGTAVTGYMFAYKN